MMATTKMVAAAEKLAGLFDLDPNLVTGIQTQRGDPPVRAMLQREAVANFLETLVKKVEIEQKKAEKAGQASVETASDSPPAGTKKSSK